MATQKPRIPDAEVAPEFLDRWSPRAFSSEPLTPGQVASLFEAMRWAPSCFNDQPWRLVYGLLGEPEHARINDLLAPANQLWASKAPLLLVLFNRRNFAHNGKQNRNAAFDTGAAWMSLALEARKLGLYAHGMAGFDVARAHSELGVDEAEHEAQAAIAVGRRGDPETLPEKQRAMEFPNGRNPQTSFAFHGRFPAP